MTVIFHCLSYTFKCARRKCSLVLTSSRCNLHFFCTSLVWVKVYWSSTFWGSTSSTSSLCLLQPVSVCFFCLSGYSIWFDLFLSLRISWPMHQRCVAAVVSGARSSIGVYVRPPVASGCVCNSVVIPPRCLPLHPLLLGAFSCSCFGRQHRWVRRFILNTAAGKVPCVCGLVLPFGWGFLLFLWVII